MIRRRRGHPAAVAVAVLLGAALVARVVAQRGRGARVVSVVLHRLRHGTRLPAGPEESRLYTRGRRRLEAHLGRRHDGRRIVLALPVDGSAHSTAYTVDESRPWHDFERQAGMLGAAWGPCRDASAGL